jgi:NAD(P)-dependent dehydrogenase (short-subunit alcohol dehydrogenase family)
LAVVPTINLPAGYSANPVSARLQSAGCGNKTLSVRASGAVGVGSENAAVAAVVPILAVELKPIRVNGVSPGVIDTPW